MRKLLVACFFFLQGCYPGTDPGDEFPYLYPVYCLRIHSQIPLDKEVVLQNVMRAQKIYDGLYGQYAMCNEIGYWTYIKVLDKGMWDCASKTGHCDGWADPVNGASIDQSGLSFLHELFHFHDFNHTIWGDHPGWEERGIYDAASEYEGQLVDWRGKDQP